MQSLPVANEEEEAEEEGRVGGGGGGKAEGERVVFWRGEGEKRRG